MAKTKRRHSQSGERKATEEESKPNGNKRQKPSKALVNQESVRANDEKKSRRVYPPQKIVKPLGRKSSQSRSLDTETEKDENLVATPKKKEVSAEEKALITKLKLAESQREALQAKVDFQETMIAFNNDTILQLHSQCTCTVCLELAYRPHVLSPCGHVFCARCLVLWFKKALPDEPPLAPYLTEDQLVEERNRRTLRRKKLCPHCRERVQARPSEIWMIKGLVEKLDEYMRSGQDNDESRAEISEAEMRETRGENLIAGTGLWDSIFPHNNKPYQHPIFDEEDNVYRCGMCMSEIVNRRCTNAFCAIEFSEEELDEFDEYSDFDVTELMMGESVINSSDEEEWEEDDHGFIDDGPLEIDDDSEDEVEFDHHLHHNANDHGENGDVQLVAINGRNVLPRRRRRGRVIALSDSEEDSGDRRARSPPNPHFSDGQEGGNHDEDDNGSEIQSSEESEPSDSNEEDHETGSDDESQFEYPDYSQEEDDYNIE